MKEISGTLDFPPAPSFDGEASLRRDVRAFLAEHAPNWSPVERAESWVRFDRQFSRAVGRRGWIGMTWPRPYGHGRSQVERYIVVEEMLAVGAPVGAHWIADRQSGPLIIKRGTQQQKDTLLPGIVSGDTTFCIGMSEPNSGSDLASIVSRALSVEGGWRLNGRKVWTTGAHEAHYMIGLFRTGASASDRQVGLTQFIVDLSSSGIGVRPIHDLAGGHHFNEVSFDDVFVPHSMVLGKVGEGWEQVVAELAYERSGPERYLTAFPLLPEAVRQAATGDAADLCLGEILTDYITLRQMSLSVAGQMDTGGDIVGPAAMTKDLGTVLEQRTPDAVRQLVRSPDRTLGAMLDYVTCVAPTFSIRGGTRSILRGIAAKGLGLR